MFTYCSLDRAVQTPKTGSISVIGCRQLPYQVARLSRLGQAHTGWCKFA